MNQDKYVFAQLTAFLNRTQFNNFVRKYDGNRYVKQFTCWNQLLAMMFGQLSNRESLRDLIVAFEAHRAKQYHLGLGRNPIVKATLAYARIFEDFAFYTMKEACERRATNILEIPGNKYAFDSTTIPLCLSTFPWAKFRRKKGGVKAHVLYDIEAQVPAFYTVTAASKHDSTAMCSIHYEPNAYYIFDRAYDSFKELYRIHLTGSFFVVRAKTNLKCTTVKWKRRMPKYVLTDAEVKLTGYLSEKKYPESFRLIRYYDEEDDREFTFLTNATHVSALDIANLYKKRWLVELFFKWLKQHLKIKRFWGTTENAVRIQISVAIITDCLVAIVQHDMQLKRSTYEVLQILSISLTDKTHLRDLFDKTNFNDVKELDYPLFEGYLIKFLTRPFLLGTNDSFYLIESNKEQLKDFLRNLKNNIQLSLPSKINSNPDLPAAFIPFFRRIFLMANAMKIHLKKNAAANGLELKERLQGLTATDVTHSRKPKDAILIFHI